MPLRFFRRLFASGTKPARRPTPFRRLLLESLEARLAPASTTAFTTGLLTVTCDDGGNSAILSADDSGTILLNGTAIAGSPSIANTSQIKVLGGNGADIINLSGLTGFVGTATLDGGGGNDSLIGGPGTMRFTGGAGDDILTGGPGTNRLVESGDVNFILTDTSLTGLGTDVLANFPQANLAGGAGNNVINAAAFSGRVTLAGGAGNDTLTGGASDDSLVGGPGNDRLNGGGGTNTLITKAGTDTLIGLAGTATVSGGLAPITMGTPAAPRTITIGASATPVILKFGRVTDVNIISEAAIQSLTAIDWLNGDATTDLISAPSLGVLSITGSASLGSRGDFKADLKLGGAPGGAPVLGTATIKGALARGTWTVGGKAGAVTAGSTAANWSASFAGAVTSFTTLGDSAGTLAAASFGTVTIKHDLRGTILAGTNLGADGRLGGSGAAADVFAAGSITRLAILHDALAATVGAGVDPVDGLYHNSNDAVIGAATSAIKTVTIGGSASLDSYFRAGAFPGLVRIGGVRINPSNDPRFKDVPPVTFHALAFTGTYPAPAPVTYTSGGDSVQVYAYPGQVQIFAVPTASESALHDLVAAKGGTIVAQVPYLGYYLAAITPGTEDSFITAISADASVHSAAPNTPLVRGAAPFVDVGAAVGPFGELPMVVNASGNVGPNLSLFAIDDFVNADLSCGTHSATHGDLVNFVESKGFSKPALGIDIARSGHADEENAASDWATAFALVAQQLAANPGERAVINISIEGGGDTVDLYRGAMLDTFRLYARELSAVLARDPSLFDRIAVVAIAGNGFNGAGVDLSPEIAKLRTEFPALFGIGPPVTGPHMLIIGGTKEDSTDVNTRFNYSSNADHMIYAPSQNVVVCEDGDKSSGTSYAAPAVSNLLGRILAANPGLSIAAATKALLAAYKAKGSLPSLAQVQKTLDNVPSVSIDDVSHLEGNSGSNSYTFTVTLSAASSKKVTVNFATANGSATAGSDYAAKSGILTFNPGQTSKTVTVVVKGDTLVEPDESFLVKLTTPTNAVIDNAQGVGTIVNDDTLGLSIGNVSADEGNSGTSSFVFTVTLSTPSSQTVTVDYTTSSVTAGSNSDYLPKSGTLTFNPGQTSKTISVTVNGDAQVEGNETFQVNLSNGTHAIIADNQAIGTILNDDGIRIQGTVTNAVSGAPIGGALLLMVQNAQQYSTLSSANGSYRLFIPVELADQTAYAALQVSAANYVGKAVAINLSLGDQTKNVALQPLSNNIIIVETPLHHLGDSYFTTALNAGLQTLTAQGTVFTKTFSVSVGQLPPNFSTAQLELSVNAAESGDIVSINGTTIASLYNSATGPQSFQISFPLSLLHSGNNTFRIASVDDSFGGLDDFEFSNVHIRLS